MTEVNKWERFDQFSSELGVITNSLNNLFLKYGIANPDEFISFHVIKERLTAFVNYEAFPEASEILAPSK